jgi:hypothetical protein
LIRIVARATGFMAWTAKAAEPEEAAAWLLRQHSAHLAKIRLRERRDLLLARLALPATIVVGLLALLATGALLAEAIRVGTPVALADESQPARFVTEGRLPAEYALGIFPRFALMGVVGGESVRLPVHRDMMLQAASGAVFTVVPTQDPLMPWLPQTALSESGPVIALGPVGIPLIAFVVLPIPLGMWLVLAALPLRCANTAAARARVTRQLLSLFGFGAAIIALVVFRTL